MKTLHRRSYLWLHVARQMGRFSADDPEERCGFLVAHSKSTEVSFREVPNTHEDPAGNSRISIAAIKEQQSRPGVIYGVLHTHPGRHLVDLFPSATDLAGAARWPTLIHVLYHPYTRSLVIYRGRGVIYRYRVRAKLARSFR